MRVLFKFCQIFAYFLKFSVDFIRMRVLFKGESLSRIYGILGSFLSGWDQCTLYMNAGIIEFVSLEQVFLVKLKNVYSH